MVTWMLVVMSSISHTVAQWIAIVHCFDHEGVRRVQNSIVPDN